MGKDLIAKIILRLQDEASRGLDSARDRVRGVGQEIARVKQLAIGLFTFAAIKEGIGEVINLSDTYARLTGRVKQAVGTAGDYIARQNELYDIAQRTNVALSDTVALYARSAQALKNLSNGQALAARLTEIVNLSFKAQSSSAAEVASTVTQLTQAIATDAVQWEDFGRLADTNLMLVNVAAKNLGYDGIGSLKQAMSDGKVGNVEMVNAIVAGFDEIKAAADKMPVTVGAAWTNVQTALLKYVGQSEAANGATHTLAEGLQLLAGNIKPLAEAGLLLAEVYGVKLALGLLKSGQAFIENARAARQKAVAEQAAQQAALACYQTEAQVAAVRMKAAATVAEEARLYARMTVGTEKETAAKKALIAAVNELQAAQSKAASTKAALDNGLGNSVEPVSRLSAALDKLRSGLSTAFIVKISIDAVGGLLNMLGESNEKIRIFSFAWQAAIDKAMATVGHFLSGDFLTTGNAGLSAKFDEIDRKYGDLAVASTDSAQKIQRAETAKTQAIEAETSKQQAAFKVVQDAVKEMTAIIDTETKMQTAAIEQGLSERLALIDAMNLGEAQKDTLRVQAKLEAAQLEIELQSKASAAKLALIDQEYQKELAGAANNAARTEEIETQKRQAKLAVYSGLAEYYQGEVNRLGGVYASEMQAAALAKQQLQGLNQSHEQALFNIKLMGMTEREKLDAKESRFNELTRKIKEEQRKGEAADHEKIKGWLTEAKGLHENITSSVKESEEAQSDARSRINELHKLEVVEVAGVAKAHEDSAKRAKAAQAEVAEVLGRTQRTIADITEALNKDYALKIGIDSASLSSAQAAIADLVKPETKTITIETVNAGGGNAPAAPATGGDSPAEQATGGPAGQPSGEPWRFNQGGHAPMSGKLPGYGGGDKIKALLEPGEFIIRKEAVQKLGTPFMHLVNAGKVPVGDVIRRATGGIVSMRNQPKLDLIKSRLPGLIKGVGAYYGGGPFDPKNDGNDRIYKDLSYYVRDLMETARTPFLKGEAQSILGYASQRSLTILNQTEQGPSGLQKLNAHARQRLFDNLAEEIDVRVEEMIARYNTRQQSAAEAIQARQAKLSMPVPATPTVPDLFAARPLAGLSEALKATPFADIQEKLQQRTRTFNVPMPTLPAQAVAPAGQSAAATKMMRVQFAAPGGAQAEGLFNQPDATAMLRVLKDAGARTV